MSTLIREHDINVSFNNFKDYDISGLSVPEQTGVTLL